jgi:hypothetical protein
MRLVETNFGPMLLAGGDAYAKDLFRSLTKLQVKFEWGRHIARGNTGSCCRQAA